MGGHVTVAGWGLTETGMLSNILQKLNETIVRDVEAIHYHPTIDLDLKTLLCTRSAPGHGACKVSFEPVFMLALIYFWFLANTRRD